MLIARPYSDGWKIVHLVRQTLKSIFTGINYSREF